MVYHPSFSLLNPAVKLVQRAALLYTLFIILASRGTAQISPGELSTPHSKLEGISNCTQCHNLGKTISSDRCLACHVEIRMRIETRRGLHGRNSYQQCIDCHKEHHGKEFSVRRLDTKTFDHSLTGYVLTGKHNTLECRKCHEEGKVKENDIAEKPKEFRTNTYLGLSPDCVSCHRDVHLGQLPQRCDQCHTLDGWKPATKFSHDRAIYKLTGKHANVDCAGCHKKVLDHDTVVQYTRLEFGSCSSCHTDPHENKFKQTCETCHTTAGWNEGGARAFDHSLTQFPLKGKHASVHCEACHKESAMRKRNAVGTFAIAHFKRCSDCHADAHDGQFASRIDRGKCESCHSENGFVPSTYTVIEHKESRFDLTGAHIATSCTACHLAGAVKAKSTRLFRWKGELRCLTCHTDVHKGQFQSSQRKDCESCHVAQAWSSLLFSHEVTQFPLRGKHAVIACVKCHAKVDVGMATERVQYRSILAQCRSCHTDEHEGQLSKGGITDCARCHSAASWKIEDFNHTLQTRYVLTGKHTSVSCAKCHIAATINHRTIARYKPLGTACVDCHPASNGHEHN